MLEDQTVAILSSIGHETAPQAKVFGAKVIATAPSTPALLRQ
jgi:hypothetical protein